MAPVAGATMPNQAMSAADASVVATCPDPLDRPVLFTGSSNGELVEVHFSVEQGLVIYRLPEIGRAHV